ncbi:M16 family metallopeptidase [Vreelandella olivaria]|uniref:M16 family metallopeptidase n=1 Tax=Vreelandella olivaria TaxID=390919 RepID=UPI00201FA31D|nr:pitrilysin family protein [Halomonas olivaria]
MILKMLPCYKVVDKLVLAIIMCVFSVYANGDRSRHVGAENNISTYQLENGLRLILAPDNSNKIFLNVIYQVGSLADPEGKSGTAHLLEHLMFKGTVERPGEQWINALREQSIAFNATTSFDRTRYTTVLESNSDQLDALLALEAERMTSLSFDQTVLALEVDIVSREREVFQEDPFNVLISRMFAAATPDAGFGRQVLGQPDELQRITEDSIRQFHDRHYRPDRAFIVITGGFQEEVALDAIENHFSKLEPSSLPERASLDLPSITGPVTVESYQGGMTGVVLGYSLPPAQDERHWSLSVLADIYAGEPHGYLYQTLVAPGAAQGVSATYLPFEQGGYFLFGAIAAPEQSLEALAEQLQNAVVTAGHQAINAESLQRALRVERQTMEYLSSNSEMLAEYLSEAVVLGDWQRLLLGWESVPERTVEEVQRQAKHFLVADRQVAGLLLPGNNSTNDIVKTGMPRYEQSDASFELPQPSEVDLEGINQEISDIEQRIERHSLSNGMQVALLPRNESARIHGVMTLRFGDTASLRGLHAVTDILGTQLIRGTHSASYQEVVDQVNELGASVSIIPNGDVLRVRFESPRESIEPLLALLADILKTPALSQEEFDIVKRQLISASQTIDQRPVQVARRELRDYTDSPLEPDDIRRRLMPEAMQAAIEATTLRDIREFHETFYGAANGKLTIMGGIDSAAILTHLEALFGDWSSQVEHKRPIRLHTDRDSANLHVEADATTTGHYLRRFYFPLTMDSDDAAPLLVATHILGGDPLNSRLGRRLREQEGMTYNARASAHIPSYGNESRITIQSHYPLGEKEKFLDIIRSEVERFIEDGVAPEEVEWSKTMLLQSAGVALDNDRSLVDFIHRQLEKDVTVSQVIEQRRRLSELTSYEINEVIKRYLPIYEPIEIFSQ